MLIFRHAQRSNEILSSEHAETEHDLQTFYRKYVTSASYPNLSQLALRIIALLGSTYCCEQFFSRIKNVKIHTRSKLTDEHLTGILRIAISSVPAGIDHLCKQKQ